MLKPCGTTAACQQHYLKGEKPCAPCRLAANLYKRERWARIRGGEPWANTTPRKIADYLETHGPMEATLLVDMIRMRHDVKEQTIRRALYRMVSDGRVVSDRDDVRFPTLFEVA